MSDPVGRDPSVEGEVEYCYRHRNEATRIHCARCGKPICPACMIPAPVGHQCPDCVAEARRAYRLGPARQARRVAGTSMVRFLLIVIAAVFAVEAIKSNGQVLSIGLSVNSSRVGRTLLDMGALVPVLVAHGQWWRLITAMFLHLSLLHIAFNAYALWLLGSLVEPAFGRIRFLLIFLVSGFMGNVASYVFGNGVGGVGASGAVFGLLGALVAYNLRRRSSPLAQAQLRWAAMLLVLNAVLAAGIRQIDWRAHLGGFVGGLLAGAVLEGIGSRSTRRAVQVVGTLALVGLGIVMTIAHSSTIPG